MPERKIESPLYVENIQGWQRMLALRDEPPRLGDYFTETEFPGALRDRGTDLTVRITFEDYISGRLPFWSEVATIRYAKSLVAYLNWYYGPTGWRAKLFALGGRMIFEGRDPSTGNPMAYNEFFIIGTNLKASFYPIPGRQYKYEVDLTTGEIAGWRERFVGPPEPELGTVAWLTEELAKFSQTAEVVYQCDDGTGRIVRLVGEPGQVILKGSE